MTVTNHDHPGGATSGCYTPRRVASGWGQIRLLHRGQLRLARPRAAVDIFYWGIANFGDHHQYLGSRYEDVWGFGTSPYETERQRLIARLAATTRPRRILEVGAAEGHL